MAAVYQAQCKDAEAEALYKRVLAIDEKALGKDLPPNQFSPRDLSLSYQTGHPGKGD